VAEPTVARLIVHAPDAPEMVFPLVLPIVRIGRSPAPQNDLVLVDGAVSRSHARIFCDHTPFRLQDTGSSNGTALNDLPLSPNEMHPLADGDIIAIGPFRLTYLAAPEPEEELESEPVVARIEKRDAESEPTVEPALRPPASPPAEAPPPTPPRDLPRGMADGPTRWLGMPADASRWLQYLPPIYAEDEFLGRFLLVFEDLLGPVEQIVAHFDLFLDPETCPEPFLPLLAHWLGVDLAERWPTAVKRQLVKHGAWLHRARGTLPGLRRHLEICSGGQVTIRENVDRPHTLAVRISSAERLLDRPLVEAIIRHHCPAHVGYTIETA